MDDNKKLNQPTDNTNSDDYQKILDEAAASVKPEDIETQEIPKETTPEVTPLIETEPTAELKEVPPETKPEESQKSEEPAKLKDINAPQLEAPDDVQSIPADIPDDVKSEPEIKQNLPPIDTIPKEEIPKTDNQPSTENHELPPLYNPPKENLENSEETPKSPEEVKAQIDKILADDSTSSKSEEATSSVPPKKSNGLKNIFILSLIIFFVVVAFWVYFLFFYQPAARLASTTSSPTPTDIISQDTCELNGETYQIGESFPSADGCNTCTCESASVIACTEMACDVDSSTSTSSATTTKTEFQKMITDLSLYKEITEEEKELHFSNTSSASVFWPSLVESSDEFYSFAQNLIKGSIEKLTINHSNLSSILTSEDYKNGFDYNLYLTPNYKNWSNKEFKEIDFNKYMTGLGDLSPVYAYSDKLVWDTVTCGGARAETISGQQVQDQCNSIVKEIETAFP